MLFLLLFFFIGQQCLKCRNCIFCLRKALNIVSWCRQYSDKWIKTVQGFNRVASIIYELSEEIDDQYLSTDIFSLAGKLDIQRLGYLWEYECEQKGLANKLFDLLNEVSVLIEPNKLNPSLELNRQSSRNRWKININAKIEIDQ